MIGGKKNNILICGDSFAADWSVKYDNYLGWPELLCQQHCVSNIAEAGVSEYKIWLQIKNSDLSEYDKIIIFHTSPLRIPVDSHPLRSGDTLHKNCDLIYADLKNSNDQSVAPIVDFFEKYFSIEYATFVHELIIDKEKTLLRNSFTGKVIHAEGKNWGNEKIGDSVLSFDKIFKKHPGLINHYSEYGNKLVYEALLKELNDLH